MASLAFKEAARDRKARKPRSDRRSYSRRVSVQVVYRISERLLK